MATGYRQALTRNNVNNNNAEILNNMDWDFDIINWPSAVYFPGNDIFAGRLLTIGGLPTSYDHQAGEVEGPAGFKILQIGDVDHGTASSVNFEFQDYEDCSIGYLAHDYFTKIQDPQTKQSMPKKYLVIDIDAYQLNILRQPVYKWELRTGLPVNSDTAESWGNKREPGGKVTMGFNFEFWEKKYLNTIPVTNS